VHEPSQPADRESHLSAIPMKANCHDLKTRPRLSRTFMRVRYRARAPINYRKRLEKASRISLPSCSDALASRRRAQQWLAAPYATLRPLRGCFARDTLRVRCATRRTPQSPLGGQACALKKIVHPAQFAGQVHLQPAQVQAGGTPGRTGCRQAAGCPLRFTPGVLRDRSETGVFCQK